MNFLILNARYLCLFIFFALGGAAYSTEQNPSPLSTKEMSLISHVKKSIENAQNSISQLTPNILNIDGMSSSIIRHFLNNVCALKDGVYLEIGCWKGSTLVSAVYKNQELLNDIIAIDNWSQFDAPKHEFLYNINTFLNSSRLRFLEADCFALNKSAVFMQPVNIYFYDGGHTFSDQKNAFTFYNAIFDDVFIAMVDDWNCDDVRNGTHAAFKELKYEVLYEQAYFTPRNADRSSWWNGFYIAVVKKADPENQLLSRIL